MCRMLAVASRNIEDTKKYFDIFLNLASYGKVKPFRKEGHHDGWGAAGFLGYKAVLFHKSSKDVVEEKDLYLKTINKLLVSYSRFAIVHFRKASKGSIKFENTHPFVYDNWIFAHNGTIMNVEKLKLKNIFCKGNTDSERFFNFIVENIGSYINFIPKLIDLIRYVKLNTKHTSLTFLLANESFLCTYREYSLKYAEDNDNPIWNRDYYTLYYTKNNNGIIFCSEPLTKEKWYPIRNSHLVVVERDEHIVFNEKI